MSITYAAQQVKGMMDLFLDQDKLENTAVHEFMGMFIK